MADTLAEVSGNDIKQASQHYVEFLAAGFPSGALFFYEEDILVTPLGPQIIASSGRCAHASGRAGIGKGRKIMPDNFDDLIRAHAALTPCADGGRLDAARGAKVRIGTQVG